MRPAAAIGLGLAAAGATFLAWRALRPKVACRARRKILYGVVGEGMGHAMRSGVVIDHLVEMGHEVEVVASGRAADYLSKRFGDVRRIHGLHMIYEDGRMLLGETVVSNIVRGLAELPGNVKAYFDLIDTFKPELVISDFESWTYLYGKLHGLPILSIDNMQAMARCSIPESIRRGHESDFQLARAFVAGKLPMCDRYIVATFFRPEQCGADTVLVPPILRREILDAKPSRGRHLLVYQTTENASDLDALRQLGVECRVYGARRNIQTEQADGSIRHMPFSEERFVNDLASCLGVIASGGFTLMGEAIYLRKPMLAVPIGGQFEQVMNARHLEAMGYGVTSDRLDTEALRRFLGAIPACEKRLSGYRQDGNRVTFEAVDSWVDRAGCVA